MPGNSPPSIQSPLLAVTHRADALKFFDFRANVKILPRNFRAFYHTIVRKPYAYRANFNASALNCLDSSLDVSLIGQAGSNPIRHERTRYENPQSAIGQLPAGVRRPCAGIELA